MRVSVDWQSGKELARIWKRKNDDLEIYMPVDPAKKHRPWDIRISARSEEPAPPVEQGSKVTLIRVKNRRSYSFDIFRVDWTQLVCYDENIVAFSPFSSFPFFRPLFHFPR